MNPRSSTSTMLLTLTFLFLCLPVVQAADPVARFVNDMEDTVWIKIQSEHNKKQFASRYVKPRGQFDVTLVSDDRFNITVRLPKKEEGESGPIQLKRFIEQNPDRNVFRMRDVYVAKSVNDGRTIKYYRVIQFKAQDARGGMHDVTDVQIEIQGGDYGTN